MAAERPRPPGGSRLQDVIKRLQEARARAPRGSDATWAGPVADSGSLTAENPAQSGELLWKPFQPKALERTRPFRTTPPSRDEFESHLSQFLGAHTKRTGPLFRAQGLAVRFGAVHACTGIDLELNDGEIVAVVGPNGAGKTALCDALGGFTPHAGRVYLGERELSGLPAVRRAGLGVARTFARPALFESMTAIENLVVARHRFIRSGIISGGLGLALSRHQDDLARRHGLDVLDLLGVAGHAGDIVATLSVAVRRLVELGRALATEPRLAILDEPSAGLSGEERRDLSERIVLACDELGVAVLLTDADLGFCSGLADYIYVLEAGALVDRGEPADVAANPRVAAAWLRRPPDVAPPPDSAPPPDAPPWPDAGDN